MTMKIYQQKKKLRISKIRVFRNCGRSEKLKDKIRVFREHRRTQHSRNIIVINRSIKTFQALSLPKVMNLNPRSAMNKTEKLKVFNDEENVVMIVRIKDLKSISILRDTK